MGDLYNKIKSLIRLHELKDVNFWRAVIAEVLVSAIYIIIVCGTTVQMPGHPKNSFLHGSLTVGFTVAALAGAFWNISGGHFNPAVTLALAIAGKVSITRLVFYVAAQMSGSVAGGGILYFITPKSARDAGALGSLVLHPDVELGAAFLLEVILTYQFIFVVMASTDPDNNMTGFQPPFIIGLSVAIGLLMGIPYTGAALNPIRAFGPGVVMNKLDDHWVYWIGPLVGSSLASLSYKYIFKLKKEKAKEQTCVHGIENRMNDLNEDKL